MEGLPFLRDLVVLLAVGIAVVVIAQRLRLPTVAGYLLAGVAIGPYGFGLIARNLRRDREFRRATVDTTPAAS